MLDFLKKIFTTDTKKAHKKGNFILSEDENHVGSSSFKNISQAIEATQGKTFYIHERTPLEIVCRGKWKDYILQKEIK